MDRKVAFMYQVYNCIHGKHSFELYWADRLLVNCIEFPSENAAYIFLTSITNGGDWWKVLVYFSLGWMLDLVNVDAHKWCLETFYKWFIEYGWWMYFVSIKSTLIDFVYAQPSSLSAPLRSFFFFLFHFHNIDCSNWAYLNCNLFIFPPYSAVHIILICLLPFPIIIMEN